MSGNKRRVAIVCICLILIVTVVFAVTSVERGYIASGKTDPTGKGAIDAWIEMNKVTVNGEDYLPREGVTNFLVIGLDQPGKMVSSGSYNNTVQADFLLLVSFDDSNKSYSLLQINRDTMTEFDVLGLFGTKAGTRVAQIALSHTYGDGLKVSCNNTVSAVSRLLYGTRIDGYVSLTMDAVGILTDYIGGVQITFDEDYTEINDSYRKGETVLLRGDDALGFTRARGSLSDSSNLYRMRRQKLFLNALVDTLARQKHDSDYFLNACQEISDYMVTESSITEIQELFEHFSDYRMSEFVSPKGEARVGDKFMEFYIDTGDLESIVTRLYFDRLER